MAADGVVVRLARPSDVRVLVPFIRGQIAAAQHYNKEARAAYAKGITAPRMARVVKGAGFAAVALEGARPAGCRWAVFDSEDRGIMWLEWILVDAAYRKRGLGSRLHAFAEARARAMGARKIWGDSRASNYQARALERGSGIRTIGRLRRHWFGQDYIMWEKELD